MNTDVASRWALIAVLAAAIAVLFPFWAPLLLAVYLGLATRPMMLRLVPFCRGHRAVAASITILAVGVVAAPIVVILSSLIIDAIDFVRAFADSDKLPNLLHNLVAVAPEEASASTQRSLAIRELIAQYSERAFSVASYVAGAAVYTSINLLIFFVALYSTLVSGDDAWKRAVESSPLPADELRRYGAAFVETGRGLVVGFGVAALVQGIITGIVLLALGVSQALVLGVLTVAAAIIPSIGTALVWLPVSVGLALSGRTEAAAILAIFGVAVIGTIDNVIKPVLARRAALKLPAGVVLISMLGGLFAFGPAGIIAGPLAVRLAHEGLEIRRDKQRAASQSADVGPPA